MEERLHWPQALVEGLLKEFPNTLVLRVRMPIVADLTYPRNFITKIIKYDRVCAVTIGCMPARAWLMCQPHTHMVDVPAPYGMQACHAEHVLMVCADHQHPQLDDSAARAAAPLHQDGMFAFEPLENARMILLSTSSRGWQSVVAESYILSPHADRLECPMQAERKLTGIMNYTNPGAISHNEILQLYKEYIDPEFTWKNFTVEEQAKVIVAPRSNNLLDTTRVRPAAAVQPVRCCCVHVAASALEGLRDTVRLRLAASRSVKPVSPS